MLRRKFAQFMQGRYGMYGVDKFSIAILIFSFAVGIVSMFFSKFRAVYIALRIVEAMGIIYWFFRICSKNIYARQKENTAFVKIWGKINAFFKLQKDRIKDRKTNIYRKCPGCKAVLRLPKSKGKHTVRCPKCQKKFDIRCLF